MMNIKTFLKSFFVSCLFFVAFSFFAANAQAAPRLYFDPSSQDATIDTEFEVKVQIDVESQSAFGADAIVNFPSGDITVKSVTNGGFFSDFSYAQTTGKLEIHGFFSSLYASKSGSGTLAVLKLSSNKNTGAGTLSFTCTSGDDDTQIINTSGTNILSCSSLSTATINYKGSSSSSGGWIPDPDAPTNACGGTCGSHYNCNSGLFCYSGFCRNPLCAEDLTCGCKATPTPASKAKATPKSLAKATPEVIVLTEYKPPTPQPTVKSFNTPIPVDEESSQKGLDVKRIGLFALIAAALIFIIVTVARGLKKKGPPEIKPPTTYPPTPTPPIPPTPVAPPMPPATPI